ncbi:carbon-nitrogen hydrolase family protein [Vibrio gallicus]|uniref:carbon-nitrogen hydrolase family protein n=1 Tax=Vibrio gallicus TaxID=190897 RepID=UPI0021C312BE|nr:carbon-nitrogen hydrolase family protein [Vibrio gallicus]
MSKLMSKAKIGLIQMCSTEVLQHNLDYIEQQVKTLSEQGCKVVVTPENCLMFADKESYQALAEPIGTGPVQQALSSIAAKYGTWLIIGSFPTKASAEKLYSTCLVYDDLGLLVTSYNKIHLFDVDVDDEHGSYRESDTFAHGSEVRVVDTPAGKLGLSICYDVRFANLYREMRIAGAEVIIVAAAFTAVTGEAHWETLLRARAIENQVWVIGVGQCGYHSHSRQTWGHSMIIDPWGSKLTQSAMTPGNLQADIDLSEVERVRHLMPVSGHFHSL